MSLALNTDFAPQGDLNHLADEVQRRFVGGETHKDREGADLLERIMDYAFQVQQQLAAQEAQIARLEALSRTDDLTGLMNRRGLEAAVERLLADAARHGRQGVICYLDIDRFKSVNDRFGHAAGDMALQRVAGILADNIRTDDLAARVGGDEFVVVLTTANIRDGLRKARALQNKLNGLTVDAAESRFAISVSLGIQPYDADTELATVLHHADNAMYAEKRRRATNLVAISG